MQERYRRNLEALSATEQRRLRECGVCVIGCGGLGGYVVEMLGRLGVGYLTVVDHDVFTESNLNRQIFCTEDTLGHAKAEVACQRMQSVNPDVPVRVVQEAFDSHRGPTIVAGHHVVVDALDTISSRLVLQDVAEDAGVPLVHGGIGGWFGQVTTVLPGDRILTRLYPTAQDGGQESPWGNPAFTPALVAAIQVSEVVKVLLGRGDILRHRVLFVDMLHHEYEVVELTRS